MMLITYTIFTILISQTVWADDFITAGGRDQANLGAGFNTDKKEFRGSCIKGSAEYIGQNIGYVNLSLISEQSAVSSALGIEGNARYKFGSGSASASAKFMKNSESDNRSIALTFLADYTMKSSKITNIELSDVGRKLKDTNDDSKFMDGCGDEYVEQINRGAKLLLNIRIDFASESDKNFFSANASYSSSVASAYAALQNSKNRLSKRTKVLIEAIQLGGDTRQLGTLFKETSNDTTGSSNFIKCSFGDLAKCEIFLTRVQQYIGEDLERQLEEGANAEGGPAHLSYVTKEYVTAGLVNKLPTIVNKTILDTRNEIDLAFNKNQRILFRARNLLLEDPFPLSISQRKKINNLQKTASDNQAKMVSAAIGCYDSPADCVESGKQLFAEGTLSVIDENELTISPEMYRQFCYEGKSPGATVELASTINVLIDLAKVMDPTTMSSEQNDGLSECDTSYSVFNKSNTLDVSLLGEDYKNKIYTLEPLKDLVHLTKIKMNNQHIRNLEPLVTLKQLRELDLSNNDIKSILELSQLPDLEILNLAQNKVRGTEPLNKLTQLERLDIRNNIDGIDCPELQNLKICKKESYMRKTQIVAQSTISSFDMKEAGISLMDKYNIFISNADKAQILNTTTNVYSLLPNPIYSRTSHTATTLQDGRVLLVGGNGSGSYTAEVYDPNTNSFTEVKRISKSPRASHQAILLTDGKVLITGGIEPTGAIWSPNNASPTAEMYDPTTNTLEVLPYMSNARLWHKMTLLTDGRVLITGGYSRTGGQTTAEIFDPNTNNFSLLPTPMADGRAGHTASLLLDGRVLIAGGIPDDSVQAPLVTKAKQSLEIFDPNTETFSELPDHLKYGRSFHTSALLPSGHVVFIGGARNLDEIAFDKPTESCGTCIRDTEIFSPKEFSVSELPSSPLSFPRAQHVNVVMEKNKVIILGGRDSRSTRTAEVFTHTLMSPNKSSEILP